MQSARGAQYFMMLINRYLSYKTVAFLKSKSADVTLNVFEMHHNEAECQTGRKLKQVRLNMGREWHNRAWEEYGKRHRLVFEFMTSYAHQQNRMVKRTLWTTLNGARTALAESGLPTKYWADAVQITTYVRNLIPLSQRPNSIPAELWHRKQQDVLYLRPFGATAYAHVPVDLNLSKLYCHKPTRPYRGVVRDVLGGRRCSEDCRNRRRWTGLSFGCRRAG